MRRVASYLLLPFLCGGVGMFAQTAGTVATVRSKPEVTLPAAEKAPSFQSAQRKHWPVRATDSPPYLLRNITLKSWGVTKKTPGPVPGRALPWLLTPGPFTSHGMACPGCLVRSTMERVRPTLPPFGAKATLPLDQGRTELFAEFGGIDYWKPANTLIEPGLVGKMTPFNDVWITQGILGGKIAVDAGRHVWVGAASHLMKNFNAPAKSGAMGKEPWQVWNGSLGFRFGH